MFENGQKRPVPDVECFAVYAVGGIDNTEATSARPVYIYDFYDTLEGNNNDNVTFLLQIPKSTIFSTFSATSAGGGNSLTPIHVSAIFADQSSGTTTQHELTAPPSNPWILPGDTLPDSSSAQATPVVPKVSFDRNTRPLRVKWGNTPAGVTSVDVVVTSTEASGMGTAVEVRRKVDVNNDTKGVRKRGHRWDHEYGSG